jgi:hypothetical protein
LSSNALKASVIEFENKLKEAQFKQSLQNKGIQKNLSYFFKYLTIPSIL